MNDTAKTSDMPAALAELTFGAGRATLQIDSMEKAWRLARLALAAKTAAADSPEAMTICILYGNEIGLPPFQSMQKISIIGGHPVIWGDAALSLVMNSPFFEDIEERVEGEGDARTAYCTIIRKNQSPKTSTFSVADAKRANLWDDRDNVKRRMKYDGWFAGKQVKAGEWAELPNESPWHCYSDRMLQMRARGFRLRDSFPDVLGGLYIREEFSGTTIEGEAVRTIQSPPEPPEPPMGGRTANEPPEPPEPDAKTLSDMADAGPPEPPARPVDHPHVTGASGAGVSVAFMSPEEADHVITLFEERAREAANEDALEYLWGEMIQPLIDADRLDDDTLGRLQNIDDERRGFLQRA